jgi:O-acetyl-ADP-ribose deacetylase (regulator of RNase III)
VQTIVNTVNCVGVMGKGLALEVKKRFPDVYRRYRKACKRGQLGIGKLQLVKTPAAWVLNFPTKRHWRGPSNLPDIEEGLKKFVSTYKRKAITSIAFPPLGCGAGGLKWEDVKPVMEKYLAGLDGIEIYVCLAPPKPKSSVGVLHRRRKRPTNGGNREQSEPPLP